MTSRRAWAVGGFQGQPGQCIETLSEELKMQPSGRELV